MDAFPAFIPLAGRRVVIAGSGPAAEAKARLFEGSPASLVRLEGSAAFLPGSYKGAALAFVASDDATFRQSAAAAARSAGVLLNVVDHPAECDFYTPAVVDRGEVVAAVGTNGSAPALAALLRTDLEARVPPGAGHVAALLHRFKDEVRDALPDPAERRDFLREAVSGPVADAAMRGDTEEAGTLFLTALAERKANGKRCGRIDFAPGRGPAERLSLRAARTLGEADVLVAPGDAAGDVLALARREAERARLEHISADTLIAWARAGQKVVVLITAPPSMADLTKIAAAEVPVEVLAATPAS